MGDDGNTARAAIEHAEANARAWFSDAPASGSVHGSVVGSHHRRRSSIYVIELSSGTWLRRVVAKAIRLPEDQPRAAMVAELRIPPISPDELSRLTHRGVEVAYQHFADLDDRRLGAIRPLAHLAQHRTTVMEHVALPTLQASLGRAWRFAPASRRRTLMRHFHGAGAWLAHYQSLADVERPPFAGPSRPELEASVTAMADRIVERAGPDDVLQLIRDSIGSWVAAHLPSDVPAGLSHGDYAPRNVFVGPEGRVIAFDAFPRWQVPRYLDAARFLVSLRRGRLQALSMGLAHPASHLDAFEDSFLSGYGAGSDARSAIRLFEILVLLDAWTVLIERLGLAVDGRPRRDRLRLGLRSRLQPQRYRAELRRHSEALGAGAAPETS